MKLARSLWQIEKTHTGLTVVGFFVEIPKDALLLLSLLMLCCLEIELGEKVVMFGARRPAACVHYLIRFGLWMSPARRSLIEHVCLDLVGCLV